MAGGEENAGGIARLSDEGVGVLGDGMVFESRELFAIIACVSAYLLPALSSKNLHYTQKTFC